jgi:alginate O-acetyltransferase complex protein AlgI
MTLTHILVFVILAVSIRWLLPRHWRTWALLLSSLLAVYWLQPSTPIRHLDFWLPTVSITLTILVWGITSRSKPTNQRQIFLELALVLASILIVGLTRYIPTLCCLTPTRPPNLLPVVVSVAILGGVTLLISRLPPGRNSLIVPAIAIILGLFIGLKYAPLSRLLSAGLRSIQGQSTDLASALDLPWLGFSYLAFRLVHALRDHQAGKLPPCSLVEFSTYAIFFPTVTAGPIDRTQHFLNELRKPTKENFEPDAETSTARLIPEADRFNLQDLADGGERIFIGVFKKFVLADSLALFALNAQNAGQISSTFWTWVILYAFTLRIYFDFSGYTDVAIGLGRLVGIRLPENFDQPYLKQNLTAFWNSWHITLAQWFRAYFFNPLTRSLRSGRRNLPVWLVILTGQLSTMVLIGLWHGITWSFLAWGAWHGVGLFIHNRWSDWLKPHQPAFAAHPRLATLASLSGWLLTFHFVLLGWVWFALPRPALAWKIFRRLLGVL